MKIILSIILLCIISSCSKKESFKGDLTGNYAFYSPKLMYVEVYISDTSIYIFENGGMHAAPNYTLRNDSLFLIQRDNQKEYFNCMINSDGSINLVYVENAILKLDKKIPIGENEISLEKYINSDIPEEDYFEDRNIREEEYLDSLNSENN